MADKVKLVAFSGSTRKGSFNRMLLNTLVAGAKSAGAEVTVIELRDFPMPLYDGDLEASSGIPEHGKRLKELLKSHHGFLIASPEYNSSYSAVLKNAIDWASRPEKGEPSLVAFKGKIAGLVSASPGALGGLRGLSELRALLHNIGVVVIPDQMAVGKAHEAFDDSQTLKDEKQRAAVSRVGSETVSFAKKLA